MAGGGGTAAIIYLNISDAVGGTTAEVQGYRARNDLYG